MRAAAIVALCACGRLRFDAVADAGQDAPTGPFSPSTPVAELNTPNEESDPTLTSDLLEMYFDSDRPGAGMTDVWHTTRANIAAAWDAPTLVTELSTANFDGAPGITPDGLLILFTSDRPGGAGNFDLWTATRASRQDPWSTPTFVPELSSADSDSNPQLSPDGLTVWFESQRGGTAANQLYRATRASVADAWSTPTAITELDIAPSTNTGSPWVSADATTIYFESDRPGGLGANDIWRAERASSTDPFGTPTPEVELNSTSGDQDPWLSSDQHTVFFASKRGGDDDLYTATR